jgi:hypothetical protein
VAIESFYSFYWLLLIPIVSGILGWYFYRKNPWLASQHRWLRITLPVLRALGISLMLVILLGITFLHDKKTEERPVLITVIDHSSSVVRFQDSLTIKKNLDALIDEVKSRYADQYELAFYTVGDKIQEGTPRNFTAEKSNHEVAFKHIAEQYLNRNVGAVIFASDGNYNTGESPSLAAEQLNLTPIFSLGIGDTTPKRDQAITNLFYNDVVFLDDQFPIEVDIESFKIQQQTVKVSLSSGNNVLQTKEIRYGNEANAFRQIKFDVVAKKVGFQPYTVTVQYLNGEYSQKNNQKTCYIEVVDSRSTVCLVSNTPHPDIAAMRSVVETNKNYTCLYHKPAEMLQKQLKPELMIWFNPGGAGDKELLAYVKKHNIPVFYLIPSNFERSLMTDFALFTLSNVRNQSDELQASLNPGFTAFTLSEATRSEIERYPPLTAKFGRLNPSGSYENLLMQKIGSTVKDEALLFLNKSSKEYQYGVVFGEGLWRWRLSDYMKNRNHEHFNELFNKLFTYLLIKRQNEGLSVQFDKRFNKYDRITVNANFYNASLEAITTPEIAMEIINEQGKKYTYQFNRLNEGYALDLGILPPGRYTWTASTTYKEKKFAKKGTFLIEDIALENSANSPNHGILKELAANSKGAFYPLNRYQKMLDDISKRSDITILERISTDFWNLIDVWILIIIITAVFVAEWFLKRYYGAY